MDRKHLWIVEAAPLEEKIQKTTPQPVARLYMASAGIALVPTIIIGLHAQNLLPSWEHAYPALLAIGSTAIILILATIWVIIQKARMDISGRRAIYHERKIARETSKQHLTHDLTFTN